MIRTRLCALDTIHTTNLKPRCQMHFIARSEVHLRVALKYTPKYALKHTPEHALQYAPNCTRWHTPSLLGSTLPSTLSRGKTLPISLDNMLLCMLLRARSRDLLSCRRQAPGGARQVAYGGLCWEGGVWSVACGVWRVACGRRRVAGGGRRMVAEIVTSVDILV